MRHRRFWHGTKGCYDNMGCRCAPCRLANRVYMREYRERKRLQTAGAR